MWQLSGVVFPLSLSCSREEEQFTLGLSFLISGWWCKAAPMLSELNQTHEMRATLKERCLYRRRGGTGRISQGFNEITLPVILGGSEWGSREYHRGLAPKLFSLGTFLKPFEEAHLRHLKWLCHHLYFCSNSGFNGFSELLALKPYRKNSLVWVPQLLLRSNVTVLQGQLSLQSDVQIWGT